MAIRQPWQNDWILIEYVVATKKITDAFRFADIRQIQGDSRLISGDFRRTFEFTFHDGSTYAIPDDAVVASAPNDYQQLIGAISAGIKV